MAGRLLFGGIISKFVVEERRGFSTVGMFAVLLVADLSEHCLDDGCSLVADLNDVPDSQKEDLPLYLIFN